MLQNNPQNNAERTEDVLVFLDQVSFDEVFFNNCRATYARYIILILLNTPGALFCERGKGGII